VLTVLTLQLELWRRWQLPEVPLGWWLLALALVFVAQCLLIWRWRLYLAWLGAVPPWRLSLLVYLQGWAFLLTPARSGEVMRVALLHRRCGVPHAVGLAALLAERSTGLVAAVLLLSVGLAGLGLWAFLVLAVLAAALVWCLTHPRSVQELRCRLPSHSRGYLGKLFFWLSQSLDALAHLRQLLSPRALLIGIALALGAWMLEATIVWSLWHVVGGPTVFGATPGLLQAAVVRVSLGLGAVVSMLPAGIGIADGTAFGVALLYGVATPVAIATVAVCRVFTVGLPLLVGVLAWLINTPSPSQRTTP
jgi:uncharacterized protein (TIRG00374 family)